MSILDRFKIRKKKEKKEIPEKKEVLEKKVEKPLKESPRLPTEQVKEKKAKKRKTVLAFRVLKSPYITEKSTELAKRGQYTFKVFDNTNKSEIKKAIKEIYGVDVERVKIIKKPSKKKRSGRQEGRKPGFKKAIVRTKKGQKIDVFPPG